MAAHSGGIPEEVARSGVPKVRFEEPPPPRSSAARVRTKEPVNPSGSTGVRIEEVAHISGGPGGRIKDASVGEDDDEGTIISEIPDDCDIMTNVNGALWYCKRHVLVPYLFILGIVGLKPFEVSSSFFSCLNKAYVFLLIVIILTGHSLHVLTCFRRDKGFDYVVQLAETSNLSPANDTFSDLQTTTTTTESPLHVHVNGKDKKPRKHFNTSVHPSRGTVGPFVDEYDNSSTAHPTMQPVGHHTIPEEPGESSNICVGNLFFIQILPSALHLLSFLYMLFLYWSDHDEQLENLMGRVFIQATQAFCTVGSQKKVLRTLKLLALFGLLWLIASIVCSVFQIISRRLDVMYLPWLGLVERNVLAGVMGVLTLLQDILQVTVITSYCIQCSLLSNYLEFISCRVSQNSIDLMDCIKEIGELEKLLKYINGNLSKGVLPLVILDSIYCLGSFSVVVGAKKSWSDVTLAAAVSILWLSLLSIPVLEAAKLSVALKKVRELGHFVRMRPFGYQSHPQGDLDSFLLFVSTLKMEVRMFQIPFSAPKISSCIFSIILLVFVWGYFF